MFALFVQIHKKNTFYSPNTRIPNHLESVLFGQLSASFSSAMFMVKREQLFTEAIFTSSAPLCTAFSIF